MGMTFEAEGQDANIQPPRKGQGVAQAVDTTARAYDISALAWNGQTFEAVRDEAVYLNLRNDGLNPIYVQFAPTNVVTLNEATVTAAGSPMVQSNAVPDTIPAGQMIPVRIQRSIDVFIHLKSSGGTSTLRIFPSSESTPKPG